MEYHGLILVDKPRGATSHDVVALVRRRLRVKRVGHAGTLDPAAEGLLIIAVGRATKLIDAIQQTTKQYVAHVVLGAGSRSGDIEGPLGEMAAPAQPPLQQTVEKALQSFMGEIEQRPPAHSAIKIGGQPAYRYAHAGKSVDVPSRRVTIFSLRLLAYAYPDIVVAVDCSPGTYIRSLAVDIGATLDVPGYLHALVRTGSGRFSLADAWSLVEIGERLGPATFSVMAIHPVEALSSSPCVWLDSAQRNAWYDGRPVTGERAIDSGDQDAAVFDARGNWVGVGAGIRSPGDGHIEWQPRLVVGVRSHKATP